MLVVAGFAVLTLALTAPLAWRGASAGPVNTGDGQLSIWNVSWVARALVLDPGHVYDANIFAPHKNTLAFSEANIPAGVLGLPAWWLTRNPYATYNSAVCLSLLLAALATFGLVTHLTGSRDAAAVAGHPLRVRSVRHRPLRSRPAAHDGRPAALALGDAPLHGSSHAVACPGGLGGRRARRLVVRLLRVLRGDCRRHRHGLLRGQPRPLAPAILLGTLSPLRRGRGAGDPAVLHSLPGPPARRGTVPDARRRAAVFRHVAVVPVLDRAPAPPRDWVGPAVRPGRLPRAGAVPGVRRVRPGRGGRRHGADSGPETFPVPREARGPHTAARDRRLLRAALGRRRVALARARRLALHRRVPGRAWLVAASRAVSVRDRRDAGLHGSGGRGAGFAGSRRRGAADCSRSSQDSSPWPTWLPSRGTPGTR